MIVKLKYCDDQVLAISADLAETLHLKDGEESWLHLGANKQRVVIAVQETRTYVAISRQWAANLKLTPGTWKIRRVTDGLRVGPVIGVVCNKLPKRPPAESNWSRYLKTVDAGLAILLTPEGFDFERRCVYGFTLSENKLIYC